MSELKNKLTLLVDWLLAEGISPPTLPQLDENNNQCPAYRWQMGKFAGRLIPIWNLPQIELTSLIAIDDQKKRLCENTEFFLSGKKANNVLLTGARGSGKSSLIRALLRKYYQQGLRLIEVDRNSINDWHRLISLLSARQNFAEKYILFCDDLSFEKNETEYKSLKSLLDGGMEIIPPNVLIYATSNRRHLVPEYFADNLSYKTENEEIHAGEVVEEKISLSDRFGLWLSFYSADQDEYLQICQIWLKNYGVKEVESIEVKTAALRWSLMRGGRNGRIAEQFARDYSAANNVD